MARSILNNLASQYPLLLGVLNITPDSFSDGGTFLAVDAAVAHARRMVREGAHALDLGAESTRPGARGVSAKVQKQRLLPVLKRLRKLWELNRIPLSIDTQSAEVARACLGEGADMINDISALQHDRQMAKVIARAKCPVILMHMQGTPRTMQKVPKYQDVVDEIDLFFRKRIHAAHEAGIAPTKILLDPGIGFGKSLGHNLEILGRLVELKALGRPLVVGVSRKRFLGTLTGEDRPERRIMATIAAGVLALAHGAAVLRVHDVAPHAQALKVAAAILKSSGA
ncbi:MAG: dihydropteroate synthase [Planctomycetes bacterium]|nr:dihydropteroate synthase [Planctomycetota bacterium]